MEIKRDYYLNKLIGKEKDGLIKIVAGIRRCGKSYLLDPIFKNYLLNKKWGIIFASIYFSFVAKYFQCMA